MLYVEEYHIICTKALDSGHNAAKNLVLINYQLTIYKRTKRFEIKVAKDPRLNSLNAEK